MPWGAGCELGRRAAGLRPGDREGRAGPQGVQGQGCVTGSRGPVGAFGEMQAPTVTAQLSQFSWARPSATQG